jgi:8-oxo-dGTP diphosphatase
MTIQVARKAIEEATKLLARRTSANRLTMFHGTASGPNNSRLRSILKHGLIPTAPKAWADDPNAKQVGQRSRAAYGGTYFSANPRVAFSSVHKARGNDNSQYPVIITATIQPRAALPDEDDYTFSVDHAYSYATKTADHPHTDGYYYLCLFLDGYNDADLTEARQRFADSMAGMLKRHGVDTEPSRLKKFTDPVFDAEVIRRVANQKDDWYGFKRTVQSRALEWYKYHLESPRELSELPKELQEKPSYEEGETLFRMALDTLTKATRRLAIGLETHSKDAPERFRHVLRVMEPVTFRGRNRITSIVSLPDYYSRDTGTPVTVVSHYGDPTPTVQHLESEGYEVDVISPKSAVSASESSSRKLASEQDEKYAKSYADEGASDLALLKKIEKSPSAVTWFVDGQYPVEKLESVFKGKANAVSWIRDEERMREEDFGDDYYDQMRSWLRGDVDDQIIVIEDSSGKAIDIWDGWHRSAISLDQGRETLPAIVGVVSQKRVSAAAYTDETGKFWGSQGAGAVFLAEDTGRILIQHRSAYVNEPNTWGVIGGAIDSGEDPQEAMQREVQEETGYHGPMRVEKLYVFQSGKFRYTNFLVTVPHEFSPHHGWESQGHIWTTLDDLPEPLHFGFKSLLPSLQQRLGQEAVSASVKRRNHGHKEESIRALCARVEAYLRVQCRGRSCP